MNKEEFIKSFSILLVDDNDDNLYTLQHRLQRDGLHNLLIAHDGMRALEIINNPANVIRLVLLDIMMPGMNGFQVITELQDKIKSQSLIVLMISSSDSIENITTCIKLGADDFLPKPFNPQILKARIGTCIEKCWYKYQEQLLREQIDREKSRYLELLQVTFPKSIVKELTENKIVKPKNVTNVAVLFVDVVAFTQFSETHDIQDVLNNLQLFIDICDAASNKYGIEKIKTIGDSYMATSGLLSPVDNPVSTCIQWANEVIANVHNMPSGWKIRVGIDIGDVICGIIGKKGFLFDVWGRCVNTAARIQAVAKPGTICISEEAKGWISQNANINYTSLGEFNLKGKQMLTTLYELSIHEN